MLKYIDSKQMGRGVYAWLDSYHHFSFANYYDSNKMGFGVLRVVNDDIVLAGNGFDSHPHQDMEILSYVVAGELTHVDSMGNTATLTRGQVQYMSAGTGVYHSEYNRGSKPLRFLQIWIKPDRLRYPPNYGDYRFVEEERQNQWLLVAADEGSHAPISIHADVHVYAREVAIGEVLSFKVTKNRQAYLVLIEGRIKIKDWELQMRDALFSVEEDISIKVMDKAHILVIEMAKSG